MVNTFLPRSLAPAGILLEPSLFIITNLDTICVASDFSWSRKARVGLITEISIWGSPGPDLY